MSKSINAKVGSYTDKEGKEKGKWVNIGVVLSNDNGEYILLDPTVNIAGCLQQQNMAAHKEGKPVRYKLACGIFDNSQQNNAPQNNQNNQNQHQNGNNPPPINDMDDDIIF